MKLYFTPKILKKIIKLLLLFILISIIIFYSKTINVQAKEFSYTYSSTQFYFRNQNNKSYAGSGNLLDSNVFSYIPTEKNERQNIVYLYNTIDLKDLSDFENSFESDDLVYFKGIILFHSLFDVSLEKNFSFISNLTSDLEDYYNLFFVYNSSDFYATIEDFDSYITIDSNGEYAYNEVLLFSLAIPYSKVVSWSASLSVGFALDQKYSHSQVVDYGKTHGTIPTTNKNSFMQINQFVISDEEIIMSLEDFEDPLNLIHYSPDDVSFPSDNEDDNDSIISRIISNIINGIKDFGREVWLDIKTLFVKLFIPDSAFFKAKYLEFEIIFNQKFGLFRAPIDIFLNLLNRFLNLSSSNTSNFVINVPEYKIPGFNIPILKSTTYNLSEVLNNGSIKTLWILYLDFIDCFLIISFLNLAWNKISSFLGGMVSDSTYYSVDEYDTYDGKTGEHLSSRVRHRTTNQSKRRNY